jgi:hypothetical protein
MQEISSLPEKRLACQGIFPVTEKSVDFLAKLLDFLPVQVVSCGDRTNRPRLVVHIQIFAGLSCFSYVTIHSSYVQSAVTINSQ